MNDTEKTDEYKSLWEYYNEFYVDLVSLRQNNLKIMSFYHVFSDDMKNITKFFNLYFEEELEHEKFRVLRQQIRETTELRLTHTFSALLFGLVAKTYLSIDCKRYPRPYNQYSSTEGLDYYWIIACFFHDIAFHLENKTGSVIKYQDVGNLVSDFKCDSNLLEISKKGKAFLSYYRLMITKGVNGNQKVDHGIVAGILIYDYLIKLMNEARILKEGNRFIYKVFGMRIDKDEFKYHALSIAEAVAEHNIWRVSENEENYNYYIENDLTDYLVDKNNNINKIDSLSNSLLFLLGIIDTIEPIKSLRSLNDHSNDKILKNYQVSFENKNKERIINIKLDNLKTISKDNKNDYYLKVKELEKWLNLRVETHKDENKISIRFKPSEFQLREKKSKTNF